MRRMLSFTRRKTLFTFPFTGRRCIFETVGLTVELNLFINRSKALIITNELWVELMMGTVTLATWELVRLANIMLE